MTDYTWWEMMQIQKYPDLPPNEAIKHGKEEMGKRSIGNKGNPNPHLKGNPEKARELGKMTRKPK